MRKPYRAPSPMPGHEQLPDAGAERAHRRRRAVPAVPVAGHAHAAGVGSPDGERRALDGARGRGPAAEVRPERVPEPLVTALADEVQVDGPEHRGEPVRVVGDRLDGLAGGLVGAPGREAVARQRPGHTGGEHPGRVHGGERVAPGRRAVVDHDVDGVGAGAQGTHDHGARRLGVTVRAEHRVGVAVRALHEQVDVELRGRGGQRTGPGHRSLRPAGVSSRRIDRSGIDTHPGRLRVSYSTSYTALSSS